MALTLTAPWKLGIISKAKLGGGSLDRDRSGDWRTGAVQTAREVHVASLFSFT